MDKSPLSAEDFYEIDVLSDPQISPDERWVAFVCRSVDRQGNDYQSAIWLAPTDGDDPRPFTSSTHRDTSPRWSHSSHHRLVRSVHSTTPGRRAFILSDAKVWREYVSKVRG